MLLAGRKKDVDMLSYLMRQTLMDALEDGPPYLVLRGGISALTQSHLLAELESRGLITSGPLPVLTNDGIAEAKWFANPACQGLESPKGDREVG
jgi:hypothetical protein